MIRKVLKYIKKYLWRWRMKLNQEKLMQVINKEWKSKQCPMCGNNDWTIDPDIMTMLPVDVERSVQLGGKSGHCGSDLGRLWCKFSWTVGIDHDD